MAHEQKRLTGSRSFPLTLEKDESVLNVLKGCRNLWGLVRIC